MAFEVYRVRKPFRWRGWHFGPTHTQNSVSPETGRMEPCNCGEYAGDIWLVESGHPRKEAMLTQRFVVGDASLPSADELLKETRFARLTSEPSEQRELVGAVRRGLGRPAAPR